MQEGAVNYGESGIDAPDERPSGNTPPGPNAQPPKTPEPANQPKGSLPQDKAGGTP